MFHRKQLLKYSKARLSVYRQMSSSVILQNISQSQQIEAAHSICDGILRNKFLNTGLNDAFKDLYLSLDNKQQVVPLVDSLKKGIKSTLDEGSDNSSTSIQTSVDPVTKNIADISQSIAPVLKFIIDECTRKLEDAVVNTDTLKTKEDALIPYLRVLESLDFKEMDTEVPRNLVVALTRLQINKSKAISSLASKCLGLIIGNMELTEEISRIWWKTISDALLDNSPNSSHRYTIVFKLWVRWISRYDLTKDDIFQTLLASDDYWKFLQLSLVETYGYDCKKYGLHVLSKSLQSISRDINEGCTLMTWRVADSARYLQEWSRYISLIEILGIDTSLNQAEDSKRDILSIMHTQKTLIPSNWGITMLSVGLKSTMDSIRRIIVNLVLGLETTNSILLADPEFLEKNFLPVATIAPNFSVTEKGAETRCDYAESVAEFIARLVGQSTADYAQKATRSVLNFIQNHIRIHDPARICLLVGLVKGLEGRDILTKQLLSQVQEISLSQNVESYLRENIAYCTAAKLLMSANPNSIGFDEWFSMISSITAKSDWVLKHMTQGILVKVRSWGRNALEELDVSQESNIDPSLYLSLCLISSELNNVINKLSLKQMCLILYRHKASPHILKFLREDEEFGKSFKEKANKAMLNAVVEPCDYFYESFCFLEENDPSIFKSLEFTKVPLIFPADLKELFWNMQMLQATTKFVPDSINLENFVSRFRSTDVLRLGEDRHLRELTLVAYFKCLQQFEISSLKEFQLIVDEVLFYFPMTKKTSRLAMINCLNNLLDRNSDRERLEVLVPELFGIWKVFIEERLSARERDLHHSYMDLVFRKEIIESGFSGHLSEISESIVRQSVGRRSLLPYLAQKLYEYTNVSWVKELFVELYALERLNQHAYTIEVALSQTLDKLMNWDTGTAYLEEYKWTEASARALAAAHFANLKKPEAAELFNYLLHSEKYKPFEVLKRNNAAEKRIKIALFQIFTIVERYVDDDTLMSAINNHFEPALDPESSLAVRVYLEWIIARRLARDCVDSTYIQEKVLVPLEQYDGIPRIMVSRERIGLLVLNTETNEDLYGKFVVKYLGILIALATSNKAGIRHSSVAMMHALRAELDKPGKEKHKEKISAYLGILDGVMKTQQNHDNEKKFRKGTDNVWNLDDDLTLTGICGDVLVRVLDECPVAPITRNDFITALQPFSTANLGLPIGHDSDDIWVPPSKEGVDIMKHEIDDRTELSINIQTKSGAWMSLPEDDENVSKRSKSIRGNMIVLSSLVDKAPNLGGICRLCDVLGAELLCMNDLNVIHKHDFKSVAMTADQWMPMMEIPIDSIINYMRKKKMEGYTLIGLEQTDNSIQLSSDLKFPKKCVLLLGKEREGIPGVLLAELDFCVEIKQVGMVRSMNIQTATAVVVQAYSSQHC